MNWQDLGGALVKAGAPIIGNALGGPLGGMIGQAIGGVLGNALGVEPTPEAVDNAIKTTAPGDLQTRLTAAEAEAQAKWPALAEIAKAEAEAAAQTLTETNTTMRIEAASGDIVQRWWRPIYAFELTFECAICWTLAMWDLAFGAGKIAAWAVSASGLLSVYWGARFGVLGVYVNGRSREKEAALTGQPAPTTIGTLVKAATRKLRQ